MAFNESGKSCLKDLEGMLARTEIGNPDYKWIFITIAVVNSVLALPTVLSNGLVILAIFVTSTLQSPSYILLSSLAFTDLIVGLIVNPIQAVMAVADLSNYTDMVCSLILPNRQIAVTLGAASFFSLVAISVDRYLAIYLKLEYRIRVTVFRVRVIVIGLWLFAVAVGFLSTTREVSFLIFPAATLFALSLVVLVVCYVKSFRALKEHCAQINPQQEYCNTAERFCVNITKYRKVLITMAWLFAFILGCYMPMLCMIIVISFTEIKADVSAIFSLALTAVYVNSCINPIVYMVRIEEIREACLRVLRKMREFCDSTRTSVKPFSPPTASGTHSALTR